MSIQVDLGTIFGLLITGILVCGLPGVAIGYILGTKGEVDIILNLLKQFKSEGQDNKWLK